jgi:L-seryl-tRNA(Ser) seleniumtransferase
VLALHALARGREAVISRGELVEIGGSFRIPEIMGTSGARLVEIGTTNRTHLDDYRNAIGADTGAILKVHRSNFAVAGFVAEVRVEELAELAAPLRIPVIHDLGSGLLIELDDVGLTGEPTARDALRAGATLVMMSGDKLLGGPQAGLVVGKRQAIDALRSDPLARALRVDKLTLAALEATLALYREPERARREIPALAMLTAQVSELRSRAERIARTLASSASLRVRATVVDSEASVGGGAFPAARVPSVALALGEARDAADLERRLRLGEPAVIGRIADGRLLLDLRTILPRDDEEFVGALGAALAPDA